MDETHKTKATQNGTVITMAKWEEQGKQPGKYWVYGTDGWAYWAELLQPGEATGLLLNKISAKKQIMGEWYYGIDVMGQFITPKELGNDNAFNAFYEDGLTDDAYYLLATAAGYKMQVEISMQEGTPDCVLAGKSK